MTAGSWESPNVETTVRTTGLLTAERNPGDRTDPSCQLLTTETGGPKRTVLRTRTKGRNGLCQKPCAALLGQLLCLNMRQPVTPITMGMRVSMTAQNCPSAWLLGDRELNQFQKNRMNTATAP